MMGLARNDMFAGQLWAPSGTPHILMHREAQRNAESFREATRRTERPKRAQKDPESTTQKAQKHRAWMKKLVTSLDGWLESWLAGFPMMTA